MSRRAPRNYWQGWKTHLSALSLPEVDITLTAPQGEGRVHSPWADPSPWAQRLCRGVLLSLGWPISPGTAPSQGRTHSPWADPSPRAQRLLRTGLLSLGWPIFPEMPFGSCREATMKAQLATWTTPTLRALTEGERRLAKSWASYIQVFNRQRIRAFPKAGEAVTNQRESNTDTDGVLNAGTQAVLPTRRKQHQPREQQRLWKQTHHFTGKEDYEGASRKWGWNRSVQSVLLGNGSHWKRGERSAWSGFLQSTTKLKINAYSHNFKKITCYPELGILVS